MAKKAVIVFDCSACGKTYRVPAAMAGRGATCKRCGETMRIPDPPAPASPGSEHHANGLIPLVEDDDAAKPGTRDAADSRVPNASHVASPKSTRSSDAADESGELHSIDDLMAMGDDELPWDASSAVDALAGRASQAPPAEDAPVFSPMTAEFAPTPLPPTSSNRYRGGSHKSGLKDGFVSMWDALRDSMRRSHARVPLTRRISTGGVFLLFVGILLIVFGLMQATTNELSQARDALGESMGERLTPFPEGLPYIVFGVMGLMLAPFLLLKRMIAPRTEGESPIVLFVLWGLMALIAVIAGVVVFGEAKTAGELSYVGMSAVGLAGSAFGLWVLHRLNMHGDGTAVMMIFMPAVVIPLLLLMFILALTPMDHWEQLPWDKMLLGAFMLFVGLVLMGGALSFLIILLLPLLALGSIKLNELGGGLGDLIQNRFAAFAVVGLICVLCYFGLFVTRWKLMLKPVAWQLVIVLFGSALMINFRLVAFEQELFADAQVKFDENDDELTVAMRELGLLMPGVTASDRPFTPSQNIVESRAGDELIYLSNGEILVNPRGRRDSGRGGASTVAASDSPPKPMFTEAELPRGLEDPPADGTRWPAFGKPAFDLAQTRELAFWGYRMRVVSGYEIAEMGPTDEGGMKLALIGPEVDNRAVRFEVVFEPQDVIKRGQAATAGWSQLLRSAGASPAEDDVQFGMIGGIPFARGAPPDDGTYRYPNQVVYVGQCAPRRPMAVSIRFPAHLKGKDQVLACEAMARSFERVTPELGPAWPGDTNRLGSPLFDYRPEDLESMRWRTAGVFAYPGDAGYSVTLQREVEQGLAVSIGSPYSDAFTQITMLPRHPAEPTSTRGSALPRPPPMLQATGPFEPGNADERIAGAHVLAFGGRVRFVRLWNESVFARVDHGVTRVDRHRGPVESVTYYGYLGGYWTVIELSRRPGKAMPMSELETRLGRIRLATPSEIVNDRGASDWLGRLLLHEEADLPLAGGVMLGDALMLDDAGRAAFAPGFHPEAAFGGRTFPPIDDAKLKPYAEWSADSAMDKHLGDPEAIGPVTIQPLAELDRSARSTREQVEWFARTREGRLGMTLRLERLGPGEVSRPIPFAQDADTGDWRLHLGRRALRLNAPPEPVYREQGGLRVWRILMPQVPGVEMRRCYYIAALPEHTLIIVANFAHDAREQLKAFDAAVATLGYTAD